VRLRRLSRARREKKKMTVHIDNLTTEVIPEPEPPGEAADEKSQPWEELERLRRSYSRLLRDLSRTAAEGFDD
jgi:hypothetical protein